MAQVNGTMRNVKMVKQGGLYSEDCVIICDPDIYEGDFVGAFDPRHMANALTARYGITDRQSVGLLASSRTRTFPAHKITQTAPGRFRAEMVDG